MPEYRIKSNPAKQTATEIWKPVVGYEGFYEVSDLGRVRSTNLLVRNSKSGFRLRVGRILSPGYIKDYPFVHLSKNNRRKVLAVHILVLTTFVGKAPPNTECCHKDGNKRNPSLDNLEWGTRRKNMADRVRHGTNVWGERCHLSRFTQQEISDIRALYATGQYTQAAIGGMFNARQSVISKITRRESWKYA